MGQWAALVAAAGLGDPWAQPGVATACLGDGNRPMSPTSAAMVEPSTQAIPGAVINSGT